MWGWLIPNRGNFCIIRFKSVKCLIFFQQNYVRYFYSRQVDLRDIAIDITNRAVYCNYWWYTFFINNKFGSLVKSIDANLGCKLKFKRKGSWMRLRRFWPQSVSLKVGLGHYQRIWSDDIISIRYKKHLRRHSIFMIGLNWWQLLTTVKNVHKFRPMNTYTKRGIRLARQMFFRRQGKQNRYKAMKSKIF